MILSFWMHCFLDAWQTIEDSDLSLKQKDEVMILYIS